MGYVIGNSSKITEGVDDGSGSNRRSYRGSGDGSDGSSCSSVGNFIGSGVWSVTTILVK